MKQRQKVADAILVLSRLGFLDVGLAFIEADGRNPCAAERDPFDKVELMGATTADDHAVVGHLTDGVVSDFVVAALCDKNRR